MANRIEVRQWREWGDDDDTLSDYVMADGDDQSVLDLISEDHDVLFGADAEEMHNDGNLPEGKSFGYLIGQLTISDGDVLHTTGKKFRVSITEVGSGVSGSLKEELRTLLARRFRWLNSAVSTGDDYLTQLALEALFEEVGGGPHGQPELGLCVDCGAQCVSGGEGSVLCPVCDKPEGDENASE